MSNSIPLTKLKIGEQGRIAMLKTNDSHTINKLMALGVYPGLPIKLVQKSPSYVFQIGFTQIATDSEFAGEIQVVLED
jgi:Fe2+ transport system protein FeoA